MKIGIFTFHCAANYGAVLQTYCLQEVLKGMGHEVYVIDYRPIYLTELYRTFFYNFTSFNSFFAKCKGLLRACLAFPIRWKRNRAFSKFIHHHLNLYSLDLNDESNDFDIFIFGSDQIWNPKITKGFDKIYLGDFPAARGKKLISYAASAGDVSNFSGEDVDYFLSRLQRFDKVTVREKSLAEYINQKSSITSEVVFDPVLLAGLQPISSLLNHHHNNDIHVLPYLLLFQIGRNNEIAQYTTKIAKEKKLQMVDIITVRESLYNKSIKQTLSIESLLKYFQSASYIMTPSFHGTALSILFNKQFNTISVNKCTDERSLSLLEQLHLTDRMLHVDDKPSSSFIDYHAIHHLYNKKKTESYNLLNDLLSCH